MADLLNSRRYASEIPREFQHVASSMMSYGLPDLISFSIHSSTQQEELRRTIERTIELFEPRLTNVKVSLVEINMDQLSARYRISARIAIHPRPEFTFDTVLRSRHSPSGDSRRRAVMDHLLPYYNEELKYLREAGAEFASKHEKIARLLHIEKDNCDDPHTERFIEAAAFLAARVHHELDAEFPLITESLLGVLYPHYLRPIPSFSIAQFELDPEQSSQPDDLLGSGRLGSSYEVE